jgi:hypothetical protein
VTSRLITLRLSGPIADILSDGTLIDDFRVVQGVFAPEEQWNFMADTLQGAQRQQLRIN